MMWHECERETVILLVVQRLLRYEKLVDHPSHYVVKGLESGLAAVLPQAPDEQLAQLFRYNSTYGYCPAVSEALNNLGLGIPVLYIGIAANLQDEYYINVLVRKQQGDWNLLTAADQKMVDRLADHLKEHVEIKVVV